MSKIGINGRTFALPQPGGVIRAGVELSKRIYHNDNSEVTVFGPAEATNRLNGIPVDSSWFLSSRPSFGLLWEQTGLPKSAAKEDIDILYSPTPYCPLISTDYLCAITIHDVSSFHGLSAGWYNKFERLLLPQMASRADLIFTVSEFSKEEICSKLDVGEGKVKVVYNGVNDFFHNNAEYDDQFRQDPYLLYVGSMSERKNISTLLKSFKILKEQFDTEHELVLIGPEWDPTNQKDIDKDTIAPIQNSVHRIGHVSDEELKKAYSSADLFVFPSLYEGFGIPPLEAMACGSPVVSSNRTAMPEVLGDAAVYADPMDPTDLAEQINMMLTDDEMRDKYVDKGYSKAAEYTWDKSADRLYNILINQV